MCSLSQDPAVSVRMRGTEPEGPSRRLRHDNEKNSLSVSVEDGVGKSLEVIAENEDFCYS